MFASAVKKPDIFLMARIFNDYPSRKTVPSVRRIRAITPRQELLLRAALTASPIQAKSSKTLFPVTSD